MRFSAERSEVSVETEETISKEDVEVCEETEASLETSEEEQDSLPGRQSDDDKGKPGFKFALTDERAKIMRKEKFKERVSILVREDRERKASNISVQEEKAPPLCPPTAEPSSERIKEKSPVFATEVEEIPKESSVLSHKASSVIGKKKKKKGISFGNAQKQNSKSVSSSIDK